MLLSFLSKNHMVTETWFQIRKNYVNLQMLTEYEKFFTALEILGWYWPLGLLKMIMFTGIQYLPILTTEDSEKIAPFNILSNLILF